MFIGEEYRFRPHIRKNLRDALRGYDAPAIIEQLEAEAEVFVVVSKGKRADATTFERLGKLAGAAGLLREVRADQCASDLLTEGLVRLGRGSDFPVVLEDALVTVGNAVSLMEHHHVKRGRGRPTKRARNALVHVVARILDEAKPTRARAAVNAALVNHGMSADKGEKRLESVVKLVLRGISEGPEGPNGEALRVPVQIPTSFREFLADSGVVRKK